MASSIRSPRTPRDTDDRGGKTAAAVRGEGGDTRLQGLPVLVARVIWLLLLIVTLVTFAVGIPAYVTSLTQARDENDVLTPRAAAALGQLGIGLNAFALVAALLACAIVLVTLGLALVLVWRRGDDWMAMLISLFVIINTVGNIGVSNSVAPNFDSAIVLFLYVLQQVSISALFYAGFLLFPNGRFVPRWSWLLLVAFVVWNLIVTLTNLGIFIVLGYPLFYGIALTSIVYRYRRAMTPVQQQQTKWVVTGLIASLIANQLFWLPSGLTPLGNTIYLPLSYLGYLIALLVVPVTFFIAIQRYRLYDIDTILNRALVYGLLTVILAAIYAAGVVGSQAIVSALTHAHGEGQSPVAIVVTTLIIAALFQPLRRRVQSIIDRRFYRRKYDAAHTIANFAATLREQVDLPELRDKLLSVVDETMHPTYLSVWFRTHDGGGDHVDD